MSWLYGNVRQYGGAGSYEATCKTCGKKIDAYSEEEAEKKLERHHKRAHGS